MSDNQWWFFDLATVIAFTGALTLGVFSGVSGIARIAIVIPLVLVLPGYALVSVLFPSKLTDDYRSFDSEKTGLETPRLSTGGLEPIERLVLSVVFSLAIVPMVALFSSVTPRGIVLETVLSGLAVLTVVLALVAIVSRYRCPAERRFAPSLSTASLFFTRRRPNVYERVDPRPYNVAIAIGFVLLLVSAGFAMANPPEHDGFTEFAVETENVTGETDTMYESTYTAGETDELQVAITNREHDDREYTTVVLLERVSEDDGELTVTDRDELDRATATVADGDRHEQSLEITPTMSGEELRLTLLLYEDEPPSEPTSENAYRTIQLPIQVE